MSGHTHSPTHSPGDVDEVLEKFRAAGGRVTSARRVIVDTLLRGTAHEHLTADEISSRVQQSNPEVAVSTVYRSLEALEELGVVEHVHVGHGPLVYHLTDQPHVHLMCKGCGVVLDMPATTLEAVSAEIEKRHGFTIEPRHFAINGTCERCRGDDSSP